MAEWKVLKGEHICALWNDKIYHVKEPVVRCRDCRHFKAGEEQPPVDWCDYFHDEVTPLGFCAWGEQVSTCRNESAVGFLCSSCSVGDFGSFKFEPNYCPNCGAKVVSE